MGNYATTADLEVRYASIEEIAHLTDGNLETPAANAAVMAEAVAYAEGRVDSYIAMQHKVPVDVALNANTAAMLKNVTLDLAVDWLARRNGIRSDAVRTQFEDAMIWLEKVARLEVALPMPLVPESTTSRAPMVLTSGNERLWTRKTAGRL